MATLQLQAEPRTLVGRKVRQLRTQGIVPVVVYGAIDKPTNLQVLARDLELTIRGGGGSQLIQVNVENGETHNVLLRDLQRHPVRHHIMHADLYAISMREKQQVTVPLVSINEPEAMEAGLMILQALEQVEIEALPSAIPASIEIDITDLTLENSITVATLPVIDGVEYLTDPDETVFTMLATRVEEDAEEVLEGEEVTDGAEPEVLSKGKQDEEDAEGEG